MFLLDTRIGIDLLRGVALCLWKVSTLPFDRVAAERSGGPRRQKHKSPAEASTGLSGWAMQDLNLRLLPCEGSTLPLS